jgi:hypothetical protein
VRVLIRLSASGDNAPLDSTRILIVVARLTSIRSWRRRYEIGDCDMERRKERRKERPAQAEAI